MSKESDAKEIQEYLSWLGELADFSQEERDLYHEEEECPYCREEREALLAEEEEDEDE